MSGRWIHPEWLPWAIAAVALAGMVAALSWARARRRAARLLGDAGVVGPRRLLRDLALVAGLAAIAAAWLGPQLGTRTLWLPSAGVDVVLLFDVSRSMDAADVAPSRLARARRTAAGVLAGLGAGDRTALAAFASRGVLLTPLTSDRDALVELLAAIDTDLLRETGSRLEAGVAAAAKAFERDDQRPRVVVVMSDGEAPRRSGDSGAAAAREAAVRVVTVGIGSEDGATLLDLGVPLLDERGRPVVSRRDLERLRALAEATGGESFAADRWGDVDLGAALAAIRRDAGSAPGELVARQVAAVHVVPCAGLAFLLLWIEAAAPAIRTRRRARPIAAVLVLLVALGASDAVSWFEGQLRRQPGDPALLLGLGVARAESGEPEAAARALEAAALSADEPRLAALAYYDLGVLELDRGRYEAARDAFLDALALRPSDRRARFNLEWTLHALAADPPPGPATEPDESGFPEAEPPPGEAPGAAAHELPAPNPAAAAAQIRSDDPEARSKGERWAPALDEAEVRRWLEAVGDESGQGLRRQAREADNAPGPAPTGPRW